MSDRACHGDCCTPAGAAPGRAYSLTALGFLVHSIEEMSGLPGWAAEHGLAVTQSGFANAALGIALGVAALLLLGRTFQLVRTVQIVVAMTCGALLANVASHALISLVTLSYMPGLASAFLFVLPPVLWLALRLPLSRRELLLTGLGGAALMPLVAAGALILAA